MATNLARALKNTLYVSNIPWTIGNNELRSYFAKFGQVTRCNVVFDKDTGLSKRYGFVSFADDTAVKSAIQSDKHLLDGKPVNIALRKTKS